jgi:hypothetical protein
MAGADSVRPDALDPSNSAECESLEVVIVDNSNEIMGEELIDYAVAPDGSRFRIRFRSLDGSERSISFPQECLRSLIMTLPRMMVQALRARHCDESLRLVYTASVVGVERSSDPSIIILTLSTIDRFEVSFGLTVEQMLAIGEAAAKHLLETDMPKFN